MTNGTRSAPPVPAGCFRVVSAALFLLMSAAGLTAQANPASAVVETVRQNYRVIEDGVRQGLFRQCRFELGGGQNATEYTVHYQGGHDADFERDPYAAPFALRRVALRRVLPAAGPGTAVFYYDAAGALSFVLAQGPDLCAVGLDDIAPATEIRAYFAGGRLVRAIFRNLMSDAAELTWDAGGPATPELQARAVKVEAAYSRRAAELRQALELLAR